MLRHEDCLLGCIKKGQRHVIYKKKNASSLQLRESKVIMLWLYILRVCSELYITIF